MLDDLKKNRLEPTASDLADWQPSQQKIRLSIAISLKRIADALDLTNFHKGYDKIDETV